MTAVPVTPAVAAVAARVGMDPARDRARFLPEIVRRLYSPPPSRQPSLSLDPRDNVASSASVQIDLPLSVEFWSARIFRHSVPVEQLLGAVLVDRRAALLARGLWAADDETLAFYGEHPALLVSIYERAAPAFCAFASGLRVRGGRVDLPGGSEADPLWIAAVRVRPDQPEAFLRALFMDPDSRTAYLLDVIDAASPPAQQFALGSWIPDAALRAQRFVALATAVHAQYREWHVDELPFARPLNDLAILLLRVQVGERGEPSRPADRRFWASALNTSVAQPEPAQAAAAASHPLIDAAWLVQAFAGDMYARGERLDQFAFGQRVFGSAAGGTSDSAAAVLRELPTRRMLLLGLERIGATDPALFAAALQQARNISEGGGDRFWSLSQFQAALAMIVRMTIVGSIAPHDAQALVRSLVAVPVADGAFHGALAEWLRGALAPEVASDRGAETAMAGLLAGGSTPGNPHVDWEEQRYRLDLAYAERQRISAIRARQGGPDLDTALQVEQLGRDSTRASSPEALKSVAARARALLADRGDALSRPRTETMPPGVPAPRDGREWLSRSADELDRAAGAGDVRRAARAGESLLSLSDVALGHALLSLVYAVHLGDPDGPALLGANVALRHDFGFGRRDSEGRTRGPWALPRQDFQPGVPWHVTGSLVGLDVALAPLALHRMSMDGLAAPPRLQSIEREAFAMNVALLNARRLDNIARDQMLARIARGRTRVRALSAAGPAELARVERRLAFDGWRGRTVRWILQNEPRSMENQFSLADLLVLGGDGPLPDAWGASGMLSYGCLCTRFPEPRTWRILSGRTQMAMMAAANVEMTLAMTERLAVMRLPAALLPSVLQTAMQDFVDASAPADANDFAALVSYPRQLDSTLVEDYVAATATLDGPLVALDAVAGTEP